MKKIPSISRHEEIHSLVSQLSAMVAEEWKASSFYSNKLLKMAFAKIIFDIVVFFCFVFFVKYNIHENGRYQESKC